MRGMAHQHRDHRTKDEWLTPLWLLQALGAFDLDPCAPVDRPWDTAAHHYTIDDDGLILPWFGRVWMNPPYGRAMGVWMARLADHARGTALIFARTETDVFHDHVWDRAHALLFLHGRLHFHHRDGSRAKHNGGAPSVLIAYGADDATRLAESGLDGKLVPLLMPRFVAIAGLEAMAANANQSWREVVLEAMANSDAPVRLDDLYRLVEGHPKTALNANWRAKLRQTLQRGPFERTGTGEWRRERGEAAA